MAAPSTVPVELARTRLPLPSYVDDIVLAGVAKTATKPAEVSWVRISVTDLCYLRVGGTAAVPGADVVDGTGSYPIKPTDKDLLFRVSGVASFSIIGTAIVGLAWYRDHSDGVL